MTTDDLKDKHYNADTVGKLLNKPTGYAHTKLSIEFTINVLEEISTSLKEDLDQDNKLTEYGLGYQQCTKDIIDGLQCKIQELKQF